ncbi:MAG: SWIM zinc finger family protein, partial [Acidimicrobiales bacterium]
MTPARRARRPLVAGTRRGFGRTEWGAAWVEALETRARLDPNRLPRGRTYARWGHVGALAVSAGSVEAAVSGSRAQPYRVRIRVRVLSAKEWEALLDVVAAQVGHAAALLDGVLAPELLDDARDAGLDLLPGPGDLQPRCSCPDWADPCKHSAAVCYLVADALDSDPFDLLLLRGRSREEVMAALRARRAVGAGPAPGSSGEDGPGPEDLGVPAAGLYASSGPR